jgi:alanine dehydrogenase
LNAAFPYIKEVAEKGIEASLQEDPSLEMGVIIYKGELRRLPRVRADIEEEE